MHYGSTYKDITWYLSPSAHSTDAKNFWIVRGDGFVTGGYAAYPFSVFPTLYLKSNVLIESGNGTSSDPYILKAGA